MFITTSGIVLRTYPFRDKKLIAKIFTKEDGVISCVVKKNKSQIALSEVLTIAEITYKKSNAQSLFYIKELQVEYIYKSLTVDKKKIQTSIVLCEILNSCVNEKNEKLYDFIFSSFICLDQEKEYINGFDTLFLIHFCKIIGISPFNTNQNLDKYAFLNIKSGCFIGQNEKENNDLIVPKEESQTLQKLSLMSISDLKNVHIAYDLNKKLFHYMTLYISTHLTDLTKLKSVKIFNELS